MWKAIKNFENYFCNENGEFKNQDKPLKLAQHKSGYANIRLFKNGQSFTYRAHRIVYETFVETIPMGYEINHKNGIKNDNKLCNLEMCTHSENVRHAVATGLLKPKYGIDHKLSKPIFGVHIKTGNVVHFASQADAKRAGFNQGNIQSVLAGNRNKHKDHKWFYA